ncbi:MAG: V-type ATP synthase subunit A [Candidatus Micrarchaeaceae archaeon]
MDGTIYRISGPVVVAKGIKEVKMYDVIKVGESKLIGEVIKLSGNDAIIQVYEDTTGLRPGEPVENTHMQLSVMLAPGLIGSIFDGIQRPLDVIKKSEGNFIKKGEKATSLDTKKVWHFIPLVKNGDNVKQGDIIGEVQETDLVKHKVMVPMGLSGNISSIKEGDFTILDTIASIDSRSKISIQMLQYWPVRIARPVAAKLPPDVPLITGQRIIDTLFPIAKGGTAAIPGPFGSGKCVSGDTPLLVGESIIAIRDLYERNEKNSKKIVGKNEEYILLDKPIPLYSFFEGRIVRSYSRILYKGKSNVLIKIKTTSGKEVKVTPIHRLFRIGKTIEEIEARFIKHGDKILAAGKSDGFKMKMQGKKEFASRYEQLHLSYMLSLSGISNALSYDKSFVVETIESMQASLSGRIEESAIAQNYIEEEVDSIEVEIGDFDVYDVSVPDYGSNFVGGYGALILHNTVIQHQLAKWSDADIIVYCGVGERGNEMAEVLTEFPEIKDPRSGKMLMDRTVFIANTSNMPVAAREASIYTSVTIAEYFRDMGYDVAVMADSTSRWAEAMREVSSRLEEMPGEEGYPAYLPRRLAEFYERGGRVKAINGKEGSVSIIGAVSPPGGDISEPISQNTLRVTRVFWALDASLASRRHFPSINWLNSYSLYAEDLKPWFDSNVSSDWSLLRKEAMQILQEEAEINDIVQLVGYDALSEGEKEVLDIAKSIREDYLQQSAFDNIDTYTSPKKQYLMLKAIMDMHNAEREAVGRGVEVQSFRHLEVKEKIAKIKFAKNEKEAFDEIEKSMKDIDKLQANA